MASGSEKLRVCQKAIDFSDRTCQRNQAFPRGFYLLADQLNRAALSIAANIAEGNGRFTVRDWKSFFGIARGCVQECVPFLELPCAENLFSRQLIKKVKSNLEEIARMLSGLIDAQDKINS